MSKYETVCMPGAALANANASVPDGAHVEVAATLYARLNQVRLGRLFMLVCVQDESALTFERRSGLDAAVAAAVVAALPALASGQHGNPFRSPYRAFATWALHHGLRVRMQRIESVLSPRSVSAVTERCSRGWETSVRGTLLDLRRSTFEPHFRFHLAFCGAVSPTFERMAPAAALVASAEQVPVASMLASRQAAQPEEAMAASPN